MTHDPTNQEGFERWAEGQGMDVSKCRGNYTISGLGDATYRLDETEYAWRGWANRPHRETRVNIAEVWPTPERKAEMSRAFEAPYGVTPQAHIDGGNIGAIRSAAVQASAEMPDLTDRVDHIDRFGYVHWKLGGIHVVENPAVAPDTIAGVDDKTLKDCAARFPVPPDAFPAFPKVSDTVLVGSGCENVINGFPPCENIAGENFRNAVRALVGKLPKYPAQLQAYFARDELLAVRKLLGDE